MKPSEIPTPILEQRRFDITLAGDANLATILRRTAARNLRRAGIAETVIMKIGGWRTRVFERYAIVSRNDIADAMRRLQTTEAQLQIGSTQIGHVSSAAEIPVQALRIN